MNSQKGFWFPSMKFSEITMALEDWGLRVSEDQIQRPKGEVVQAIYLVFLQQLTGITPESLQEPVNNLMVESEFPELHQSSLNLELILFHITRIAHAARVNDFSMKDLVFPETERTRSILSAIINFIKFCEEREVFLQKLRDHSVAALEEREKVSQGLAELRRETAEIKAQRQGDEPRCQALKEQGTQLTSELIGLKNAQATLIKEVNGLKKTKSELSRRKENIIKEIENATNAITSIRPRIVQSPDRVKKLISEMTLLVQDERNTVASIEGKTRELRTKLEALGVFEQDMKKINDILRSVHSEHMQMEELYHRLNAFKSELDSKRILREELFVRDDRAKRQMKNAEEKLQRTQRHAEDRKLKSEDEIQRLKKEFEVMSEERRENDKLVEGTKQEADEVERRMLEHLKKSESELNELLGEYWKLRHQTDVYMETLANKLGIEVTSA